MSFYKQQERDFIERTLNILEQYDSLNVPEKEHYEVTLLINCMVGLYYLNKNGLTNCQRK